MQIRDLGILTAEFDDNIRFRMIFRDRYRLCDNFLNKIKAQPFSYGKSAGSGDLYTSLKARKFLIYFFKCVKQFSGNIRVVSSIFRVDHILIFSDYDLDRC